MTADTAMLVGGAGTGKTTELMSILGKVIDKGIDPFNIGFVSFTRAARSEAANRVESEFGFNAKELQNDGYFRTLHSICFQAIGGNSRAKILLDNRESKEWIEEAVGERVASAMVASDQELPDPFSDVTEQSSASVALALWSLARNRLTSLDEVHSEMVKLGIEGLGDLAYCRDIVTKYERQKFIDDRMDFADVIGHAVGWKWDVDDVPSPIMSHQCNLPDLPVWFFDEHQDSSRLLHSVALTLIEQPNCKWAYFAGDPFQSIFGFGGADHRCFLNFEAHHRRVMQQSYRCPAGVLKLSERILSRCSDYFNREIKPRSMEDGVEETYLFSSIVGEINPSETWMLIARTNMLAQRFHKALEVENIPWDYTRGAGGYCTPKTRSFCLVYKQLASGEPIEKKDVVDIIKNTNAALNGKPMLQRGVKTAATAGKHKLPDAPLTLDQLPDHGFTPEFVEIVRCGKWSQLVPRADLYLNAERKFGPEAAASPKVRVGTIHSVKGSEADNVVLLDSVTKRVEIGKQSAEGFDAEQRVAYVGVTRAAKRLIVLHQKKDRYRMEL